MTQVLESNTITDLYNSMANVLMYNTWNKSIFNDLFTSIPTDTITFNDTNGEVTINTTAPLNVINQPLGITNLSIQNPITEATVKEICGLKKKLEVKFTHNFIIRNNNQPKTTIKLEGFTPAEFNTTYTFSQNDIADDGVTVLLTKESGVFSTGAITTLGLYKIQQLNILNGVIKSPIYSNSNQTITYTIDKIPTWNIDFSGAKLFQLTRFFIMQPFNIGKEKPFAILQPVGVQVSKNASNTSTGDIAQGYQSKGQIHTISSVTQVNLVFQLPYKGVSGVYEYSKNIDALYYLAKIFEENLFETDIEEKNIANGFFAFENFIIADDDSYLTGDFSFTKSKTTHLNLIFTELQSNIGYPLKNINASVCKNEQVVESINWENT